SQAEALHEGGGERAHDAVEPKADRDRERDGGTRPAEFLLERHHQHARRRAHAGADEQDREGDADDDPAVMQSALRQRMLPCVSMAGHRPFGGRRRFARPSPAIHVLLDLRAANKAWMRGTSPRMTQGCQSTDRMTLPTLSKISPISVSLTISG